jgi:pyridoxamine 5'-phosphate oxidase
LKPTLPEPLPASPLALIAAWMTDAEQTCRAPTAMTLATVEPDGHPSARMVICRGFDAEVGFFVFYSDSSSRKGTALAVTPRAALVFYWEALERQVRIEGPVTPLPDAQTDAYWKSRPLDARIAAVASDQSRPIESRTSLLAKVEEVSRRLGDDPPRPRRWVGYRVWAEQVELWMGQPARVHDRAMWTRELTPHDSDFTSGGWRATRLQP